MQALQTYNPGTIVEWKHYETERRGEFILKFVFWAFQPCLAGFKQCRRVISVDGTHLYTKYDHKLLIVVTLDGNDNILPLAFSLVEEENNESWSWFLDLLSKHIDQEIEGVCLISDRHISIGCVVEVTPAFLTPKGCHQYCLRHLAANVQKHFGEDLKNLTYRAAAQNQLHKFKKDMEEIKALSPRLLKYLSEIDIEKWTVSHDGDQRQGCLTTIISESINEIFSGIRLLPIAATVHTTFDRCRQYFLDRTKESKAMMERRQPWPNAVFEKYMYWDFHAHEHNCTIYDIRDRTALVQTKP